MTTVKQRNDPVRIFWRRLITFGLMILVLFALWAVVGVFQKERDSKTLREEAEAQHQELQKREAALKLRIESLETERGQEAALRDAYSVGKSGEGMIQIVDKPATSTTQAENTQKPWWERLFSW